MALSERTAYKIKYTLGSTVCSGIFWGGISWLAIKTGYEGDHDFALGAFIATVISSWVFTEPPTHTNQGE